MKMNYFFFNPETNSVVAGNKDPTEVEWDNRNDDFYAEQFRVSCIVENSVPNNQKVMQFNLPKQLNLNSIPDTNGILVDDNHSTATVLTGVSAATSIGGVEGDDKEDDEKEKEKGAEKKNGNREKNDNNETGKSTKKDKDNMEEDNKKEEYPDNLSMESGEVVVLEGITTPSKGIKQPAAISPEEKHTNNKEENNPKKSQTSGATDLLNGNDK